MWDKYLVQRLMGFFQKSFLVACVGLFPTIRMCKHRFAFKMNAYRQKPLVLADNTDCSQIIRRALSNS